MMHSFLPLAVCALLAFAPPATVQVTPLRRSAESDLSVVVVPPDGMYEVTVTPKTPAPKGERGIWTIYPRKSVRTVERDGNHWRMKLEPGTYEVGYTTFVSNVQVDSFSEFTVGQPKPPEPDPIDPDIPTPPAPDASKLPFPATGFYAMFLRQDTDLNKYTPPQRAALGGAETATYLNAKTTTPGWRVFDTNQQFIGEGMWKEAQKRAIADHAAWEAKNPGKKTPWLLCGNGTKGYSGPVPEDSLDKTLEILKRYGG
jgi:hypothetical protein